MMNEVRYLSRYPHVLECPLEEHFDIFCQFTDRNWRSRVHIALEINTILPIPSEIFPGELNSIFYEYVSSRYATNV